MSYPALCSKSGQVRLLFIFIAFLLHGCGFAGDALISRDSNTTGFEKFLTAKELNSKPLRGYNLGRVSSKPRSKVDYSDIAESGAQIVRVMLRLEKCPGCLGYEIPADDWQFLDDALTQAQRYGFYVVINFAPQPGGGRSIFWDDEQLKDSVIRNWVLVADKYKSNTNVAGYDLINEPNARLSKADDKIAAWREFAERIITAIRKVDRNHLIIFEPAPSAIPSSFKGLLPLNQANIVYSVHFYEPHTFTHQGLPGYEGTYKYPGRMGLLRGYWDKDKLEQTLAPVMSFAKQYSVPIYVGEFSCVRWAPDGSCLDYIRDAVGLFEKYGWSWTYHAFRESNVWDSELTHVMPRKMRSDQADLLRSKRSPIGVFLSRCFLDAGSCR